MSARPLTLHVSNTTSHPGGVFDIELEPHDIETLRDARAIMVELVCRHDCRRLDLAPSRLSYARQEIELRDGEPATRSTQLEVPDDAPISFKGKVIRNRWSIEVTLDIARARDRELTETTVLVVPHNGTERWSNPHPLR